MHLSHPPTSREPGSLRFLAIIAASLLLSGAGQGGTVNVNFTNGKVSDPLVHYSDGIGILGAGSWNRARDNRLPNSFVLFTSTGATSGVTMNPTGPNIVGSTQANVNLIQDQSWRDSNTMSLYFTGFVPNGFYRVVAYNDRFVPNYLTVQGVPKFLSAQNSNPENPLPGIENVDYATFIAKATAGGVITVTGQVFAGIQIQGVLAGDAVGPKTDCTITTSPASLGGKGTGVFGIRPSQAQSLVQHGASRSYFVNVKNTGAEYDKMFLMAFPDQNTTVTITDRTTRGNVTAAAKVRNYRFDLNSGATKGFSVRVARSTPRIRIARNVGIGASPSTLKSSQQDVVTCVLIR